MYKHVPQLFAAINFAISDDRNMTIKHTDFSINVKPSDRQFNHHRIISIWMFLTEHRYTEQSASSFLKRKKTNRKTNTNQNKKKRPALES